METMGSGLLSGNRHDNIQTELIEEPKVPDDDDDDDENQDEDEDVVDPPSTLSEDCVAVSVRRSQDVDLTRIAARWRSVARVRQLQHFVAAHKQSSQSATYVHKARVGVCVGVSGLRQCGCTNGYIYTGNFRQLEVATR